LSAMLNRKNERNVYFGADDDGNVTGLDVGKQTLLDIRQRAQELIDPHIQLDIEELRTEESKTYIKVRAIGWNTPYSCDGRYYIRTAASDEQI
ncbi:MAG: ATP-binding protein, partial [Lachnospiraceae bacterium]|nr:ATP-binding protein [Lachnospiraceae bacterium]